MIFRVGFSISRSRILFFERKCVCVLVWSGKREGERKEEERIKGYKTTKYAEPTISGEGIVVVDHSDEAIRRLIDPWGYGSCTDWALSAQEGHDELLTDCG